MPLRHTRCQMPVGQGFFHVGTVSFQNPIFNYVYDCGSDYAAPLSREITRYLGDIDGQLIDVLFVSHMHFDHVCGLDRLLLLCEADAVILPYLSPVARLILIADALQQRTLNATYLSFLCDPTGWLLDRGVGTVSYVTPGGDGGEGAGREPPDFTVPPADTDVVPPNPKSERQTNEKSKSPTNFGRIYIDFDGLEADVGQIGVQARYQSKTRIFPCQQPLRLHIQHQRCLNWQFVTFVHPEGEREEIFRRAVRRTFGRQLVSGTKFELNEKVMLQLIRQRSERDKLASCYALVRKNNNLTSLSVYSGPISIDGVQVQIAYPDLWDEQGRVAWIGTGDANLHTAIRRHQFMRHYESLQSMVRTMSLPHHGSRHNFHPDLLTMGSIFVVSAGEHSKHGHPHEEVEVETGDKMRTTTENPLTRFTEIFRIH